MHTPPLPQRKHVRLRPEAYAESGAVCSVTVATLKRAPIFSNADFARACVDMLGSLAATTEVAVHAYGLMPDHAHLLIPPSSAVSIIDFVRVFKGRTTRLARQFGMHGPIWQQGFYDHFLRKDEDIRRTVAYILNNPSARVWPRNGASIRSAGRWCTISEGRRRGTSPRPTLSPTLSTKVRLL